MSIFEQYGLERSAITGITEDSRKVQKGFVFAALPGSRADGRKYIDAAIHNGASVIISTPDAQVPKGVTFIPDEHPRRILSLMAAAFYGAQPETIIAVTGTNGKTSTVSFVEQIWDALGYKSVSLGTLGLRGKELKRTGVSMTTPDPVSLMADLADLRAAGVTHVAMEASSHGLDQFRLDGVQIAAAGFTNLSRDHLDYHGTMEKYLEAKARLFTDVLPEGAPAIINADSLVCAELSGAIRTAKRTIVTYGKKPGDIHIKSLRAVPSGQDIELSINDRTYALHVPFIGYFQLKNLLCAIGLVVAAAGKGLDNKAFLESIFDVVPKLQSPPGRLQFVPGHPKGAGVYVDYAHTPAALETVLNAVRPHITGRLFCVFGCGGDRDKGKRPMMGKIAAENADMVIVTDDNPRSEDAAQIRREILEGAPNAPENVSEIDERAAAITKAIQDLKEGDVLVIAGKGHEQGQIIQDKTIPFDDVSVAADAIAHLT